MLEVWFLMTPAYFDMMPQYAFSSLKIAVLALLITILLLEIQIYSAVGFVLRFLLLGMLSQIIVFQSR